MLGHIRTIAPTLSMAESLAKECILTFTDQKHPQLLDVWQLRFTISHPPRHTCTSSSHPGTRSPRWIHPSIIRRPHHRYCLQISSERHPISIGRTQPFVPCMALHGRMQPYPHRATKPSSWPAHSGKLSDNNTRCSTRSYRLDRQSGSTAPDIVSLLFPCQYVYFRQYGRASKKRGLASGKSHMYVYG